jgi:hypothetical protein
MCDFGLSWQLDTIFGQWSHLDVLLYCLHFGNVYHHLYQNEATDHGLDYNYSTVHYIGAEKQPVGSGICFSTFSSISLNAEQQMCTINNSKSHREVISPQRKM